MTNEDIAKIVLHEWDTGTTIAEFKDFRPDYLAKAAKLGRQQGAAEQREAEKFKPHLIRREVRRFAVEMEAQLKANDHKPGWSKDSLFALCLRLEEEVTELKTAIQLMADEREIQKEAADAANFAMMIFDNAEAIRTQGEEGKL